MQSTEWNPAEPPGVEPVKANHPWRSVVLVIIGAAVVLAAFYVPIPGIYAYLPGPVRDVETLVEIKGAPTYPSQGSLFLTTVSVDLQVTFANAVAAWIDPSKTVLTKQQVTGGGSFNDLQKQETIDMKNSKLFAEELVLNALGLGHPTGKGVKIVNTLPSGPAHGVLQSGDLIKTIEGNPVSTDCDVTSVLDAARVGSAVSLTVERNGQTRTFKDLKTTANPIDPTKPFLGIQMKNIGFSFHPGMHVQFKTGAIEGPSAGLMFALALYDRLTPSDLTSGEKVAGTGTIDCAGHIGPIGGIQEKVAGAEHSGAQIFLAPASEAHDAEQVASSDLKIVPVKTFQQALDYLKGLQPTG